MVKIIVIRGERFDDEPHLISRIPGFVNDCISRIPVFFLMMYSKISGLYISLL